MDLEKNGNEDKSCTYLFGFFFDHWRLTLRRIVSMAVSQSAASSEPSLNLKPKEFNIKPDRDILPEKTGNRATRWLNCA